jgi:excisionase family DNA binding protein
MERMRKQVPEPDPDPRTRMAAEGFASIPEAQKYLNLSRSSIYRLMDDNQLAFARFGRSRRIPLAALRSFAAASIVAAV